MTSENDVVERMRAAIRKIEPDARISELTDAEIESLALSSLPTHGEDVVERMARALAEADGFDFDELAGEHVWTQPRMNNKGHWLKLARAASVRATHGEDVVERMARAIRFAENPLDGDPIGVMIHNYDFLDGSVPMEQQVAQIDDVCRAIARAALSVLPRIDQEVVGLLRRIEPHLDAIVCYASDMGEHEPNRLANDVRQFLSQGEGG